MSERTGVVLAAGFGSRLADGRADATLKPLTPVAGRPLIERTLDSLALAGCSRVVTVLGYQAQHIERQIREAYHGPLDLAFVYNPHYEKSNGLSVLAARHHISDEFILVMADHVLGDGLMRTAANHTPPSGGASLLVDYKLDSIFDMDDATKVLTDESGLIVSIGKQLADFNCIDTGVFICTSGLIAALETYYTEHGDASLSQGVQALSESRKMMGVDIGDGFWQDVDTPEMLAYAERVLETRAT